jgi:hypothetical protein
VVKANPLFQNPPKGKVHSSVWDLASSEGLPEGVDPGTVDIVVMIFVLSALHPTEWTQAVANIFKVSSHLCRGDVLRSGHIDVETWRLASHARLWPS